MTTGKRRMSTERWIIVGLVVVIVSMLGGFAAASGWGVRNRDGTVNGCYQTRTGAVRVQVTPCTRAERPVQLGGQTPIFATVNEIGTLIAGKHAVRVFHELETGFYFVEFDRDLNACGVVASGLSNTYNNVSGNVVQVGVRDPDTNQPVDDEFHIVVSC
jgi:hypothetical protein